MLPFTIAGTMLGIALIVMFNTGIIILTGTWMILALSYTIRKMPFIARSSSSILYQLDPELEEASISLGVNPMKTFFKVTIRLMAGGILARNWTSAIGSAWIDDRVLGAMNEASRTFIDMHELFLRPDQKIAELCRVEDAHVTSGAGAAITLAVAACMAGDDFAKWQKLPFTQGMQNEIIFARGHYQAYTPQWTSAGAKLVEYGQTGMLKSFKRELESAVTDRTCCLAFTLSYHTSPRGSIPIEEVIEAGKKHDIPVIVDAAALEIFIKEGDSQYDRQMKTARYLQKELSEVQDLDVRIIPNDETCHEHPVVPHVPRVLVQWDLQKVKITAEALDRAMAAEDPPVFLKERHYHNYYTNKAWRIIDTYFLREGEERIVAERFKKIMIGSV